MQEDLYYSHSPLQDIVWATLKKIGEPLLLHWPGSNLREKALDIVMKHIKYEDETTQYICIGPLNKVNEGLLWVIFVSLFSLDRSKIQTVTIVNLTLLNSFTTYQVNCFSYTLFLNWPLEICKQMLNMICCWVEDPNSEAFKLHIERIYDFLWVAEDGMKLKVFTSSSAFH